MDVATTHSTSRSPPSLTIDSRKTTKPIGRLRSHANPSGLSWQFVMAPPKPNMVRT
ncbi:hypothetical protein [Amycolatopsis sp. RTGN1]|uniref:hypothetical protein n=1 Tax=Amycolatopsis ponsaeliensis TaxID=2992142 RepID=UPI00254AE478|nr:hypothetical protein [Amycolatopsis sp. RTGN1]